MTPPFLDSRLGGTVTVDCPCCGIGRIDVRLDPGEPVDPRTGGGVPPQVIDWEASCQCGEWIQLPGIDAYARYEAAVGERACAAVNR